MNSTLAGGWKELVDRYPWQWFVTLTFRGYPSAWKAKRLLGCWLEELRVKNGSQGFGFCFVMESGASGDNFHWHGFVLGLRDHGDRLTWMKRWVEIAGDVQIDYFRPDGNATGYTVKGIRADKDTEILFELPSEIEVAASGSTMDSPTQK